MTDECIYYIIILIQIFIDLGKMNVIYNIFREQGEQACQILFILHLGVSARLKIVATPHKL